MPTGPAAKKADDLIRGYTMRIEKEIEQGRKEVERLRAELHELIDVRYEMADAIAELRGGPGGEGDVQRRSRRQSAGHPGRRSNRLRAGHQGSRSVATSSTAWAAPFPKDPSPEQREQLRRLAPRADLKRMIERLRGGRRDTRRGRSTGLQAPELRAGIPASFRGLRRDGRRHGRHGRRHGRHGRENTPGFDSIGLPRMGGIGGGCDHVQSEAPSGDEIPDAAWSVPMVPDDP